MRIGFTPWYLGFLLLFLGVSITGCHPANEKAFVYVLFDQSVRSTHARTLYAHEFYGRVVPQLASGDMIAGDVITDHTEQTATNPIEIELMTFNPFVDNEVIYAGQIAGKKRQLEESVNGLLAHYAPNTDIMSGFCLASKMLKGEKGQHFPNQALIVFTDGIEQNASYDFTAEKDLSLTRIHTIIQHEQCCGRLPDLHGVHVYMVGVNMDPDPHAGITHEKMAQIQAFWIEYCKACGATLDPNNYGESLTNFTLH